MKYELTSENNGDGELGEPPIEFLKDSKVIESPEAEPKQADTIAVPIEQDEPVQTENVREDADSDNNENKVEISFDKRDDVIENISKTDINMVKENSEKPSNGSSNNVDPEAISEAATNEVNEVNNYASKQSNFAAGVQEGHSKTNSMPSNQINETVTSVVVSEAAKNYLNDVFDYIIDNDEDLMSNEKDESSKPFNFIAWFIKITGIVEPIVNNNDSSINNPIYQDQSNNQSGHSKTVILPI